MEFAKPFFLLLSIFCVHLQLGWHTWVETNLRQSAKQGELRSPEFFWKKMTKIFIPENNPMLSPPLLKIHHSCHFFNY
jgi:hypothetical protein